MRLLRKSVVVLVSLMLITLSSSEVAAKEALLFVVDGQSNAGTTGDGDKVDDQWLVKNDEVLFRSPKFLDHSNWMVMEPFPFSLAKFNIKRVGYGVELSFAQLIKQAFPDKVIAVARDSEGGTSIVAWDKNHSTNAWNNAMKKVDNEGTKPQYPQLLKLESESRERLLERPDVDKVTTAGFLWIQVERDSKHKFGAENYEGNLTNLIANVRTDWNQPELPVMFIEAHTHAGGNGPTVDKAVRAVNRRVDHTELVLVKDLPTHEGVHFNSEGTVELGRRFAEAYLNMKPGVTPDISPPISPSIQPQGEGMMVFSSDRDGDKEIFVMRPDGTGLKQLTNNKAGDEGAVWSPDGSEIAFKSDRDGDYELYVMRADGSNVRQLTDDPGHDRAPSYSPDGSEIAFSSNRDGNWEIYVMRSNGSRVKRLTNHRDLDRTPAWSPKGDKIAFTSKRKGVNDIAVINTDGSGYTNLTNNPGDDNIPAWSPDGNKIAFRSDRDGDREIFVMNANGSGQKKLTNNKADDLGPAWSPDGTQIGFSSDRSGNSEIYIMNADGSNETQVTNHPAKEDDLDWGAGVDEGELPTDMPVFDEADVDEDGDVDAVDVYRVLSAFGATEGAEDVNGDGAVNIFDFGVIVAGFI